MDYNELAELIFPNAKDIEYYEEKYPERDLEEGAMVTRFAPSPTGFVHMGSLLTTLIEKKVPKETDGICVTNFCEIRNLNNPHLDFYMGCDMIDVYVVI